MVSAASSYGLKGQIHQNIGQVTRYSQKLTAQIQATEQKQRKKVFPVMYRHIRQFVFKEQNVNDKMLLSDRLTNNQPTKNHHVLL